MFVEFSLAEISFAAEKKLREKKKNVNTKKRLHLDYRFREQLLLMTECVNKDMVEKWHFLRLLRRPMLNDVS